MAAARAAAGFGHLGRCVLPPARECLAVRSVGRSHFRPQVLGVQSPLLTRGFSGGAAGGGSGGLIRNIAIAALGGAAAGGAYMQFFDSGNRGPKISVEEASSPENPVIFLEVSIGGRQPSKGRVEVELFANICPKTAENFRCLCTGEKGAGRSGKPLHFKGSTFHRIIPGFMCQGGDFTMHNGTGGESIYGSTFADEFELGVIPHSQPLLLSMANRGANTNGSQFFLTTAATPHLDGKHVVFGRVLSGAEVVWNMESSGSPSGQPRRPVVVSDCGEVAKAAAEGK